jgi:hypothetical protein
LSYDSQSSLPGSHSTPYSKFKLSVDHFFRTHEAMSERSFGKVKQ